MENGSHCQRSDEFFVFICTAEETKKAADAAFQIINKVSYIARGCMKGPQPLHIKSAAATCAVRGAAASRFLYHFLAVCAAHKKMMLYPAARMR